MTDLRCSVAEFEQFILRPENDDHLFEYINGKIVEVGINFYCSVVAARITSLIGAYVEQQGLGFVTGAAGGYEVGEDRYLPKAGFVSKKRQPHPSHEIFGPIPPDLVVEVLSPTDKPRKVRTKLAHYMAVGTVVWLVDPEEQEVDVCIPGQAEKTLRIDDTIEGGEVLPGFKLAVKGIFPV